MIMVIGLDGIKIIENSACRVAFARYQTARSLDKRGSEHPLGASTNHPMLVVGKCLLPVVHISMG
jgi:hypothetical protein